MFNPESKVCTLWSGELREAPVMFKRNGYYYLLTSGCTGWKPNQSSYAYSRCIDHGGRSVLSWEMKLRFNLNLLQLLKQRIFYQVKSNIGIWETVGVVAEKRIFSRNMYFYH